MYGGRVKADSTIIPFMVNNEEANRNVRLMRFFEFGPNAGYAYTLIVKKHFFLTGSASVSLDYGENIISDRDGNKKEKGVSPNTFFRAFGGYNSDKWGVSLVYVTNLVRLSSGSIDRQILLNTGNFRLNLIRRFSPGKKARKVTDVVDQLPAGS